MTAALRETDVRTIDDDEDRGGHGDAGEDLGEHEVIEASDKALKVRNKNEKKPRTFWVPQSCIHDDSEVYKPTGPNATGKLVVKRWWYLKNKEKVT